MFISYSSYSAHVWPQWCTMVMRDSTMVVVRWWSATQPWWQYDGEARQSDGDSTMVKRDIAMVTVRRDNGEDRNLMVTIRWTVPIVLSCTLYIHRTFVLSPSLYRVSLSYWCTGTHHTVAFCGFKGERYGPYNETPHKK